MENFLNFYQHLPEQLSPAAFSLGSFSVDWYSLMYLVGFFVVYLLLRYRIRESQKSKVKSRKFSSELKSRNELIQNTKYKILNTNTLLGLLLYIFIGLLIGARMGYVLFYNLPYYLQNPLAVISPFDPLTHQFIGIYGMSYHGGLIGAILGGIVFAKKYKIKFLSLANFVAPAIPAGYFFGRIGNFLNGELYGRITGKLWGMYFPTGGANLRHPSQLYEAFFEGLVLFIILWSHRNNENFKNNLFVLYIFGYALARFFVEFFREPDPQVGFILSLFTLGQILSLLMMTGAAALFLFQKYRKRGII